jgi:hypothetical protein
VPDPLNTLQRALTGSGVQFLDLHPILYAGRREDRLIVYPTDLHPNELVHSVAAQAVGTLIRDRFSPRAADDLDAR